MKVRKKLGAYVSNETNVVLDRDDLYQIIVELDSENKDLKELLEEAVTCFSISDPCKFLEDNKAKLDKLLNK